ncbi:MAG: pitrilysin family protein [Deltaproteobacteria bacterium]|nr:pitrilysin family protein [Deltaproteobacteria bacterium]
MNRILTILLSAFLLTAAASPLHAMPAVADVQTFTLKNGMKVLVLEDHGIPNVTLQIFFKVGSRNEYPGITGLSHFLEHMMFNGAAKYGPKLFDLVLENAGGSSNAYTTENVTSYQDWVPKSALELIFEMEADRICSLALDEKVVESERGVVLSEYTTGYENSDYELLYDQLRAVAYQSHPYRWPIIGYESDIRNWQHRDIKEYFDRYYAPNNAVAVVVGDVTLAQVKAVAERYLEPLPARLPPRPVHTREPEQRGEKRLLVYKDVSSPHILIAYHVPETGTADYYALDLLSSILSTGKSSRLYRTLVSEKQLATEISTYMPQALDPTLFYVYAICTDGVSVNTLENAIFMEIDKVINRGVTEKELRKAQNNVVASFYRSLETMSNKADLIGTYEIFSGGYQKLFTATDAYKQVTAAYIQGAAAKYFRKTNRTVGIMEKSERK